MSQILTANTLDNRAKREVSREVVTAWLTGWTVSRQTPGPVAIDGGLRVDVHSAVERVRYVLFALEPARIQEFAAGASELPVSINVCTEVGDLAARLHEPWSLHAQRYLMIMSLTGEKSCDGRALPDGYELTVRCEGAVVISEICDASGTIVASGKIAITPPYAIVDRIGTEFAHRRRGLGAALMMSLNRFAIDAGAQTGLLVATPDGHALYSSVGWHVHTPYASAISPTL